MATRTEVDWELITRAEFQAYEGVRASGVTNMWAVSVVEDITGLEGDTILAIIKHYSDLDVKYPDVRRES